MQQSASHATSGHEYENGTCKVCDLTSGDSSEFDFIRAWYKVVGQEEVTAVTLARLIDEGVLPRTPGQDLVSPCSTEMFIHRLVGGAVVVGEEVIDVLSPSRGIFTTVKRGPGQGNTLTPQPAI